MMKRETSLMSLAVLFVLAIGLVWYYEKISLLPTTMIYRNESLGFSVEIPKNATTSEFFGSAAGPQGTATKVILDADQENVVLINAYHATSADDWLMNNVSIAIDNNGKVINDYITKTVNGNPARVLYAENIVRHAIIYHGGIVFVFTSDLRNPAQYGPEVNEMVNSFVTN